MAPKTSPAQQFNTLQAVCSTYQVILCRYFKAPRLRSTVTLTAMDIFLNGQMLPPDRAAVRFDDAGIQHAVGLFETFQCFSGRVFRLAQHLERLKTSAIELGLVRDMNIDSLAQAVEQTIEHNQINRARLRLTITAGSLSMLKPESSDATQPVPTLLIVPSEPTNYDPPYFEKGITVLIAPAAANPMDPMAGHKTLSYWGRLRTLRQAASIGAGEAIWLNVSNHLACGAVSNVFLVKDGVLFTPIARGEEVEGALRAPVLPGITRTAVIEVAQAMNVEVRREMLSIDDMLEADEVFLTNSGWHVLPVNHVEKKEIGDGVAGELTTKLRAKIMELIATETGGAAG